MTLTGHDATMAAQRAFGRHPGRRALHAKGTLLQGTFTATPAAARLTRAAHMQGTPVPVTVRVSNGSGNPAWPDFVPDVRGLAVKFYLPDGSRTDLVAQTVPHFPVATPEEFVELMHALAPRPRSLWRLPRFLLRHPRAAGRLARGGRVAAPPASYATCSFYAIHAFRFENAQGHSCWVRYSVRPEAARRRGRLPRGRDYLQREIRTRLAHGPIRFTLTLSLAAPGDLIDDPSRDWPPEREQVNAGTLELTGLDDRRERDGDILVFDPTRVTDGIGLSNDPVLRFRHAAYTDSVRERTE